MHAQLGIRDLAATGLAALLLAAGVTVGIGAASAGPSGPGGSDGALVEPGDDPFYTPPAGFESSAPGTVLATRPVTVTGLGLPVPADASQFLVRSTDAKGAPTTAVGTLMVPRSPYVAGPRPLVSYQPATDSLGDQCNPSYKLRAGTEAELPLMMQALQQGWAVVVTDYEGPRSAFAAGRMAGHAVLDGIRGAEALPDTGLAGVKTPVGLWGYSGGGLATSWAAELQPGYAPELDVAAVASGGTPADLAAAARQIDGSIASGLVLLASTGLTRAYPEMLSLLNDKGRAMINEIGDMCVGDAVSRFPFRHLNEFTTSKDPLSEPVSVTVMEANHLGGLTPKAPVFLYHS
ncbi:MAG TPA: lipase family protein, partial [Acidimicrobiia bacterium]|nr:lipase family protein [Acidimicrobiia bacterium]